MRNKNYHKLVEKSGLIIVTIISLFFALYYFVFHIDWINIYKNKNSDQVKNIVVLNESCIKCHGFVKGFSPSHQPKKIGCVSCHLGNPKIDDKTESHEAMIKIPGNLNVAKQTCGKSNCHPGISERIDSSLMTTMSGIVSVNKYAFDEISKPEGKYHIKKIGNSASESHLKSLCASCHLGNEKKEFGPITELTRGGGCNACHLNYSEEAINDLTNYDSLKVVNPDSALLNFHPSLSLNITNDHCFGCHSRSGRISTSYEGWHETSLSEDEVEIEKNKKFRLLLDGRIFEKKQPDVHYAAGLVCVDCHISYEVMGDGNFYEHKEEQILVKCEDCHSLKKQKTMTISEFDFESKKIAEIMGVDNPNRKFIKVEKSQTPLLNTFLKNGRNAKLVGKISKKEYDLNPPLFECLESAAHKNVSCNSCHTSWAPQCIGCHTEYDKETEGFDLLNNKDLEQTWVEYHGDFFAELPTLGIKEENVNGKILKKVETFVPGMIMTLDKSKYEVGSELIFKRLFAPTVAHTIQKESRSCESCHFNSLALGYGRGELAFDEITGILKFTPKYSTIEYDNLPEDAWVGFLKEGNENNATRVNVRPFNIDEQRKILTVGVCLTCHKSDSVIIKNSLIDYKKQLLNLSKFCKIPVW